MPIAERERIPLMTSDVSPPTGPVGNFMRNTGENIPYAGTGGPRAAQNVAREDTVRRLAQEFGVDGADDFIATVTADLAATRGNRLTNLSNRKDNIIDGVPGNVRPLRAAQAVDAQIARLNGINDKSLAPIVRALETFRSGLGCIKTLRQIEENRRILGDMLADPGLANVRTIGDKATRAIYGPLREDMVEFVSQRAGPQVAARLGKLNDELAGMVGDLDASTFRRVLSDADTTPERVASLLFSRQPSDVARLVSNLSPAGRTRAQSAIIARAVAKAGDLNGVQGISATRFANQLEQDAKAIGVAFNRGDAARVDGIQRLLQTTTRSERVAVDAMTGARNSVPALTILLSEVFGAQGGGIAAGALAGTAARLYESPIVRNRLISLARTRPGSPQESRIIGSIRNAVASNAGLRQSVLSAMNDNAAPVGQLAASPNETEEEKQRRQPVRP